jgi:mRNA-degrading endonuclease RelE of RelBE toxin-antitoxin system
LAYNDDVIFIETSIFTREIKRLLPDDDYKQLQTALMLKPDAGDLIRGSGGLRKIRWKLPYKGKRGALRVIYYWDKADTIFLLLPYRKTEKDDLSSTQLKKLRSLIKESFK